MKLSIIIPVYNVEKYLRQCLDSILNQNIDYNAYEVIIVNDGSPDNSSIIISDFELKHSNLKVINQENSGLSVARNNGLSIANGDYIWFVDSDDWIEKESLKLILDKICAYNTDIIKIKAIEYFSEYSQRIRQGTYDDLVVLDGPTYGKNNMIDTPVQFMIFKRSFLLEYDLKFYPNIYHEDNEFTPRVLWHAQTISFINTPIYFYRQNPTSITKTANAKKSFDLFKVCNSLSEFIENENIKSINPFYYSSLNDFICLSLNNALNNIVKVNKEDIRKFDIMFEENSNLLYHFKISKNIKYSIEFILWSVFKQYTFVYKFLLKFKINA